MNASKSLLVAGTVLAGAAFVYWLSSSSKKQLRKRFVEEDVEEEAVVDVIEANGVNVEREREQEDKSPLHPVSPRSVRLVLEEKKEESLAEEEATEFQLVSPRLEAFLTAEPKERSAKKKPVARGPKSLSKRPARAAVPKVKLSDTEEDEEMDAEEVKKILSRGKKINTAEEGAAPFPIVSPRLEKFLESK
jgi:hypothetical protein